MVLSIHSRLGLRRHFIKTNKADKMIQPIDIEPAKSRPQTLYPPAVILLLMRFPAVNGDTPHLSCFGEVIGRYPRHHQGISAGIKFEKSMKWNNSGVAFSRPLRWLVALLGGSVLPFEYAGVQSGNITRGLRPYDSPEMTIPSAQACATVAASSPRIAAMAPVP